MRARYYSPELRRFINADPIRFAGGMNWYGYAGGNPIRFADPDGLAPFGFDSWSDYGREVGQVFAGYGDAAVGTVTGLYQIVRHPIDTVTNLANAAAHPVQTYRAISESLSTTWNSGSRGKGRIVGDVLISVATVGAGYAKGVQSAGSASRGLEFSHWIPARAGGPRSIFNGNYVSPTTHALSDPYRYQFMSKAWKAENPMPNVLSQQWTRLPDVYKGTGAGIGVTGAAHAGMK
jgi:uncharacterized protein RhaS with RHS repeats